MRSLVLAIFYFTSAISSAVGEAFVCKFHPSFVSPAYTKLTHREIALATDPLLVWNYGTMAVIAGTGGCLFWLSVHKLDAQEERLNEMGPGNLHKVDPEKINEKVGAHA